MILCGFEPPAQQVEFVDPQTGNGTASIFWGARGTGGLLWSSSTSS